MRVFGNRLRIEEERRKKKEERGKKKEERGKKKEYSVKIKIKEKYESSFKEYCFYCTCLFYNDKRKCAIKETRKRFSRKSA